MGAAVSPGHAAGVQRKRRLTVPGLAAVIFYSVCGGPFGCEGTISAAGPLFTLLGFVLVPFVWSVPEALVTAELATAFPENVGFVAWVTAAFGPRWGFLEGFLSWLCAATDNALYPVLFCDYLKRIWPALEGGAARSSCVVAFSLALSVLNFVGVDIAGWTTAVLAVFTMSPFAIIVPVGLPKVKVDNLLLRPALEDVDWGKFLRILFWNLNYWDSASSIAGEVHRPEWSFPLALLVTVLLVLAVVILAMPLLAGDRTQVSYLAAMPLVGVLVGCLSEADSQSSTPGG